MHFLGASLSQHGHHGPGRGAPHDRVVHHDEAFARYGVAQRVQLAPHPEGALARVRVDEGAADIAVLHQAVAKGYAAAPAVALGRRQPRVGHPDDHVGRHGGLLGQQLAHAHAGAVQLLAVQAAVGTGQVDELEQAQLGLDLLGRPGPEALAAVGADDEHLAGLDLPHEVGAR